MVVTELDPAVAWSWNQTALVAFSAAVNAVPVPGVAVPPVRPPWIQAGKVSPDSFADDVVALCAGAAGVPAAVNNIQGRVMISPNDMVQCARVFTKIGELQSCQFVQHFMPPGLILANLFLVKDKTIASAPPCNLVPPVAPRSRLFA